MAVAKNKTNQAKLPLINDETNVQKLADKLKAEELKCTKMKHRITCLEARIKYLESRLQHHEEKEDKNPETAFQLKQLEAEILRELELCINS